MRHIPPIEWISSKLDHDVRRRINILLTAPLNERLENEFKALCRAIDRVADAVKYSRGAAQPPQEIGPRLDFAITHAVSCLNSLDPSLFGRRHPFHSFERSKSECVYGALLVVIDRMHRLTELVRALDRSIDEKLLEVA